MGICCSCFAGPKAAPAAKPIQGPDQPVNTTGNLIDGSPSKSSGDVSFLDGNISAAIWFSMALASTNITTWVSQARGAIGDKLRKKHKEFLPPIENMSLLDPEITTDSNLKVFTLQELKLATFNFRSDMVLGKGGFGSVYKGCIKNLTVQESKIAVKKLDESSKQGFQQWRTEINILARLSHPNIVKLLGFCEENQNFLIVYEFMKKGSLNYRLFGKGKKHLLSWTTRVKVMIGMARGLSYLHTPENSIIYRDFKSSNILLDEIFNYKETIAKARPSQQKQSYKAKISDFGMAKRSTDDNEVEQRVMGTKGYTAPEYIATGNLNVKSDVYGFGVVLVEMLTGMRAIDKKRSVSQRNLSDWIRPYLSNKSKLKDKMDSRLEGKYASKEASKIALLAWRCIDPDHHLRPSMKEVVGILEQIGSKYTKEP